MRYKSFYTLDYCKHIFLRYLIHLFIIKTHSFTLFNSDRFQVDF